MDIEAWRRPVHELTARGLVRDFADLYALRFEDLAPSSPEGEEGESLVRATCWPRSRQPRARAAPLLFGLGIRFVGERAATCWPVTSAAWGDGRLVEEIDALYEIGPAVAQSGTMVRRPQRALVARLEAAGVRTGRRERRPHRRPSRACSSCDRVALGMTRDEAKQAIEARAAGSPLGLGRTSVRGGGRHPGSKLEKARRWACAAWTKPVPQPAESS